MRDQQQPSELPDSAGVRSWWLDVAILMGVAIVAERLLHDAVTSVALSSSMQGWVDAIGLVVVLGPLLSWTLYRRSLESRLSGRRAPVAHLSRSPHRAVRIAVLSSLGVLTLVSLLAGQFEFAVLNKGADATLLIDHAGRQRHLSQQIARHAPQSVRNEAAWAELQATTSRLRVEQATTDSLTRKWFAVSSVAAESAAAAVAREALLSTLDAPPSNAVEAAVIVALADRFLTAQDRYVQEVGRVTGQELANLGETQRRFGIALIVLFAGIALIVVEPTVRLLRRQHAANGALGREHERLALVAQRTSSAIVILDATQCIEWVNDAFVKLTGYSLEECIGRRPEQLLHGSETDPATVAQMREDLAANRSIRVMLLNYHKSGTPYWVDSSIEPIRDAANVVTGFISVETDVTGLIEAQQALERERAELRRVAAQSEEAQQVARYGHWEYDLATERIDWSAGTYLLFGRDPSLGPPNFGEVVSGYAPEDVIRLEEAIAHTTISGEPYDLELKTAAQNPEVRHVRAMGRVRHDATGRPVALYGTAADITAGVELRAQLESARITAEDASRSKSEFLANMSHEIRSPLTVILGFTDVLRNRALRTPDDRQQLETISTIQRAGQHLAQVINDILDISKIEAGRMEVEWVETDLSAMFRDLESLLRPRAIGKGVDLRLVLRSAIPQHVLIDPTRFRQILMNLVSNAIKFTEMGEVLVEVSTENDGGTPVLVVAVEDTGIGMTAEQAQQLFEPFVQADTSVTRRFGGTGLGLTISRRLAALLNGQVALAASAPGKGSRFEVRVPLNAVEDADEIIEFASAVISLRSGTVPKDALAGCRVLLVEDGPDNQVLIRLLLEEAGATVVVAENGRIALDLAIESEPVADEFDLVLTDMQMPEMDGYTLARQLRARRSDVPIVALTANAMAEDRLRCLEAGCSDYATKPVERERLIEACAKWAKPRAARRTTVAAVAAPVATRTAKPTPTFVLTSSTHSQSSLASHPILGPLTRKFAAGLPDRAAELTRLLDTDDVTGAQGLAHQLRGTAGSYGFARITDVAGKIEDALRASDRTAVPQLIQVLTHEAEAARRTA